MGRMSDPYGEGGVARDRSRHEQETTAQPVVDPHWQSGSATPSAYPGPPPPQPEQSTYQSPSFYGPRPTAGVPQGYPQYPQPVPPAPYAAYQPPPSNGFAIASFVTSLVGTFLLFGISGIVGIVLGIIALGRSKETEGAGRGLAIAGIVIGTLQWVLLAVVVVIFVLAFAA